MGNRVWDYTPRAAIADSGFFIGANPLLSPTANPSLWGRHLEILRERADMFSGV